MACAQGDGQQLPLLLRQACEMHAQLASEARAGQGVDRHLLGLRCIMAEALDVDPDAVPLFRDPAYRLSTTWRLSTSNCGAPELRYFAFSPVSRNGIGVGYFVTAGGASCCITSNYRAASVFADHLQLALRDVARFAAAAAMPSALNPS